MVEKDKNGDPIAGETRGESGAAPEAAANERAGKPATDVQSYIGRQLRAVYDDIAKQPIPDRFLALMQKLEAKGTG